MRRNYNLKPTVAGSQIDYYRSPTAKMASMSALKSAEDIEEARRFFFLAQYLTTEWTRSRTSGHDPEFLMRKKAVGPTLRRPPPPVGCIPQKWESR